MKTLPAVLLLALVGTAAVAHADVAFSFADPAPGRQITHIAGGGGTGIISYDGNTPIVFLVDGTEEGFGAISFPNARVETVWSIGAASTNLGVTTAPVTGTFTVYDFTGNVRSDILTGTAPTGTFVRIGATNSILFSDPQGFSYTAGPALTALLAPGRILGGSPSEASFTLTNLSLPEGSSLLGPAGQISSFVADASFSGNVAVIPAAGPLALLGLSSLVGLRRRR